ncbi:MAG: Ni/Fe hydrogenase [Proteobacteria bacterium]|nr:Ni/Fe hydrogenase [Pseudomonadota bacterium]
MNQARPLLVIARGRRTQGDDALAPLLLDLLRKALDDDESLRLDLLEEQQYQPELALALAGRERVLLLETDLHVSPPFVTETVEPGRDASLASQALTPASLLAVVRELHGRAPPPTTLLRLHAHRFEPGRRPSRAGAEALPSALLWVLGWVDGSRAAGQPPVNG